MKKALEAAFNAQIERLYSVLSDSILAAAGDPAEIKAAEQRFKKGLEHAKAVRKRALELAGIS
jgi:hypothetical protein